MAHRRGLLQTGWLAAASALIAGCALVSGVVVDEGSRGSPSIPVLVTPSPDRVAAQRARPAVRADTASWYGSWHHGRPTASGELFDMDGLTAAHLSLPLGSCVEVTHVANGRRIHVRVNDRGPYIAGRTIDLSYRAAQELGMVDSGVARVRIRRAKLEACQPAD
jgi:rare lipoprotein A